MRVRAARLILTSFLLGGWAAEFCAKALAVPSSEERLAFFAERRKERAAFERGLLSETDSRAAAIAEFTANDRAERAAFQKTLAELSPEERLERLSAYNAAALSKKKSFEKSLPSRKLNDTESKLADFDKKAAARQRDFINSLDGANPAARTEAVRRFQNQLIQERAKIRTEAAKSRIAKEKQFRKNEASKFKDFLEG